MSDETEDALLALSRDLVQEIAAGMAIELAAPPPGQQQGPAQQGQTQPGVQPSPWPPKVGAAAVHPHLGGHLITALPGDTISGMAHAHVPRPVEPMLPDPKDEKLQAQGEELKGYQEWESQVRDYDRAARELETHAKRVRSQGKRLPPYERPKKKT
jgi:hypothetical protein